MARRALLRTILCCRRCGYCAPDLSKRPSTAPATVNEHQYKRLLRNRRLPELARHWACWSLVQERAADAEGAGWAALRSAWACDDAGEMSEAERFRSRAIALFREVQRSGGSFAGDRETEQLLLVDLLRRAGRFEDGLELCRRLEAGEITPEVRPILQFQRFLAEQEDHRSYMTCDAEEYAEAPDTWEPSPLSYDERLASLFEEWRSQTGGAGADRHLAW